MSLYGDPDELDRLAAQLLEHAARARQHAADHARRAQNTRWVSTAADACRARLAADRTDVDRATERLEQAAAALRAHAQQVRHTVVLIARYEREVTDWFAHQLSSLGHGLESAGRTLSRAGAPWLSWPIGPHNLPAPGDRRWLEVGTFLRGQGVL